MTSKVSKIFFCRVCRGKNLTKVFSFGPTPLANEFLNKNEIEKEEEFYPLDAYFCSDCTMLQLGHVVNPKILFTHYVYVSSTSPVFVKHFETFAQTVSHRFNLGKSDLVIDIGSNDGILLKPYKKMGVRVLGIEPATQIAKMAKKSGVDTIPRFFSSKLAKDIVKKYGHAKVVTGTNVFAHIHDLDEVLSAVKTLLPDEGVFITESPYLVDFFEKRYFDLVYHEHLSYWSIKTLNALFKRHDMEVFDVEKVSAHGGSIRVFAKKSKSPFKIQPNVQTFIRKEKKTGLGKRSTYLKFANEVLINKMKLIALLTKIKSDNKKIIGYGAPAKGNTLLNYFKIGSEILDYIVDDSRLKQGLYTPGTHIPVVSPQSLKKRKTDYMLILAWNFADSIMKRHDWFKKKGGKFILPSPVPKIV